MEVWRIQREAFGQKKGADRCHWTGRFLVKIVRLDFGFHGQGLKWAAARHSGAKLKTNRTLYFSILLEIQYKCDQVCIQTPERRIGTLVPVALCRATCGKAMTNFKGEASLT